MEGEEYKSLATKLKEFMESPQGDFQIKEWMEKHELQKQRQARNIARIKKFFNNQETFAEFVNKVCDKHDKRWRDLCYSRVTEPIPWELLYTLFDLATLEGYEVDPFDDFLESFHSLVYEYGEFQFTITHGQGSVMSVYRNRILIFRI